MEDIKLIPIDDAIEEAIKNLNGVVKIGRKNKKTQILAYYGKRECKELEGLVEAKNNGYKYVDESLQPIKVE